MLKTPSPTPDNAAKERFLKLTPAESAIIQIRIPIRAAVLRFGCFRIKRINVPKMLNSKSFCPFFTRFHCAKRFAA